MTTTHTLEDRKISDYFGVRAGQAIYGANFFRDLLASLRDIVGGRAASYETVPSGGRETPIEEMCEKAAAVGANAVIGVNIDYQAIGSKDSMLMVAATGTAIKAL